ncbi:MAG TPA: xanthine dehydrogenase family protein molybdopterin-binding subunit [Burkholderiaceae bacterium]|nr:xanthine dehydrogenase family protein molybdopterin-binding subunit [Burkholderiaceae bacterium]
MNKIEYGRSIPRREDDRLVTGRGQFVDDVHHPAALHVVFVRSPYPSARIVAIDLEAARESRGVVAVLTGADLLADGVNECAAPFKLPKADGGFWVETPRPLLARERVRFVGELVVMVVAETERAGVEAAALVMVDYEAQAVVLDPLAAAAPGAPQLWDDRPGNLAFHWQKGDTEKVKAALAASHHVARLRSHISRVSAMPIEPRGALAYLGEDGHSVLHLSHQAPHQMRNELALMFGLERKDVRVIAGDVGGSFGMKYGPQREEVLVFWAARRLQRAVRWTAQRTESFLSDEHARDVFVTAELGLDANGRFTALSVRYDVNVGAYMSPRSITPIVNIGGIAGVYTTPLIAGEVMGIFTNTQSTAAYRGAGRPDATYAIERIIDVAAAEMGIDPAELRRRNLISPAAMPYQTPFVFKYDCGEFERNLDKALELCGYASFAERREEARQRGRLRGIGIACPIEVAGGPFEKPGTEWTSLRAHADGSVTVASGTMSVGQGHDTALSSLVAQRLGLPLSKVSYVQGDTDLIENGRGNGGSSALILGGSAVAQGADELIEKAKEIAAAELEAHAADIEFANAEFRVVGTDRAISLGDVARAAEQRPQYRDIGLAALPQYTLDQVTFPNGCHVCEVEIDPETGALSVIRYISVEDVGRVLNPMLVEGQIHGGVAQGIGQALLEEVRYSEDGQLVSGSFMDYAMPRAEEVPSIVCHNLETPTALNPLGVKGVGEAGTVGALSATMNAICNALQPTGIRHFDMPATPMRIWEALRDAGYPGSGKR